MAQFRSSFKVIKKDVLHYFPGHMGKGLRQMQQKLKTVDCIIEVHDARIPMSGRNPNFKHTVIGIKPHILVLNKRELAGFQMENRIRQKLAEEGVQHVLFTSCKDIKCRGVKQIIPMAKDLVTSANRYNREEEQDINLMIIGVPNVGKSSLINTLRNRHLEKKSVLQVGAVPGVTRSVHTRMKVCEDPPMYLLDTPGILTPSVKDIEAGLRLSLCACLLDHLVGHEIIADYLLYMLNKKQNFRYVKFMKLEEPTDCIGTVLTKGAVNLGKMIKVHDLTGQYVLKPDLLAASKYFIRAFREGTFGNFVLDDDLL